MSLIVPGLYIAIAAFWIGYGRGQRSVPLANENLGKWLSQKVIDCDDTHRFVGEGMSIRHVGKLTCQRHSAQHTFVVTVEREEA